MNPFLSRLNLSKDARAVVIHADDIGMNYATLAAFPDLLDAGALSSASVMTPCPWFPGAAAMLRELSEHPRLDVGVHLTLTSEWDAYRWGPLSTRDRASGLLDREGYFHRREADVWRRASLDAVEMELRAQIEAALDAGLDITHLDSHMGALFHPRLLPIYIDLAREYGLPAFLMRSDAEHIQTRNLQKDEVQALSAIVQDLDARALPLFDRFHVMDLKTHEKRLEEARQTLMSLPPGTMTYLILHPAQDTVDLRAFTDDWPARVADLQLLLDPAFRELLDELGITIISMKSLREAMRSSA
ncbi:MAG: ChbG/HpnK family deacetylase [Chloroflexi bacterium]|nr:ChbG/HpnK family deacetylase [Chloroflexota bacterium]